MKFSVYNYNNSKTPDSQDNMKIDLSGLISKKYEVLKASNATEPNIKSESNLLTHKHDNCLNPYMRKLTCLIIILT